jgi:phosphopantothenoylcysteine synthetase/decarboxylase
MSILITSGGTKVPIDDVRFFDFADVDDIPRINNFSKGHFGRRLVESFIKLARGNYVPQVVHFKALDAPTVDRPFVMPVNFEWYDDYVNGLKLLLQTTSFRYVFLAAAVSDFAPVPVKGKIDTADEYDIHMVRLPKVIPQIRGWAREAGKSDDFIQVGFKLLSGVTDEQLIEVARKAGAKSGSNWTIANSLQTVAAKQHRVFLVENDPNSSRVEEFKVQTQEQTDEFVRRFLELTGRNDIACA